jgi:hypothetical protein
MVLLVRRHLQATCTQQYLDLVLPKTVWEPALKIPVQVPLLGLWMTRSQGLGDSANPLPWRHTGTSHSFNTPLHNSWWHCCHYRNSSIACHDPCRFGCHDLLPDFSACCRPPFSPSPTQQRAEQPASVQHFPTATSGQKLKSHQCRGLSLLACHGTQVWPCTLDQITGLVFINSMCAALHGLCCLV